MQIFNIQIFGKDILEFISLSAEDQSTWIKTMTNQQNDGLIFEFLNSPIQDETGQCLTCGKLNNIIVRHGDNISKTDADKTTNGGESELAGEPSTGNSVKRQRSSKNRKDS